MNSSGWTWCGATLWLLVAFSCGSGALAQAPAEAGSQWDRPRSGVAPQTASDADGRARYILLLQELPLASDAAVQRDLRAHRASPGPSRAAQPNLSSAARERLQRLQSTQSDWLQQASARLQRQPAVEAQALWAANALVLRLTAVEAEALAALPGVRSLTRERRRPLATFATPSLIGAPTVWNGSQTPGGVLSRGEGVLVGVIDSGINYASSSFAATSGDGYLHSNPLGNGNFLGLCASGADVGRCNAKLIGMYNLLSSASDRSGADLTGHGSHVAATAAGGVVNGAPYAGGSFNLAGVAPRANLVSYLSCDASGCPDAALLAAVEQAVIDGVEVLTLALGASIADDPWSSPLDLALLAAHDAGIVVVTAAGNDGPAAASTQNEAPWVLTVGATTPSAQPAFAFNLTAPGTPPADTQALVLAPGAAPLPTTAYSNRPLIVSPGFSNGSTDGCSAFARNYFKEPQQNRGTQAIAVLRLDQTNSTCSSSVRRSNAATAGAIAVVFVDSEYPTLNASGASYAMRLDAWNRIVAHTSAAPGSGARATISYPIGQGGRVADRLASYSARGPNPRATLKPDLLAPGDGILAASIPIAAGSYALQAGTSAAAAHVAGAAALLRALQPTWSPMEIKSALMSTAEIAVTVSDGSGAPDPNQIGAGRVELRRAARAGLLLDVDGADLAAADPAAGGLVEQLNLASLYQPACVGNCVLTRRLRASAAGQWQVALTGLPEGAAAVTPSQFALAANATVDVQLSIASSTLPEAAWQYGELLLSPDLPQLAASRLPVAVRTAPPILDVAPSALQATAEAGDLSAQSLQIRNLGNPTLNWQIGGTTLTGGLLSQLQGQSQGVPVRTIGSGAVTTSSSVDNAYAADDFTISSDGTVLASLEVFGYSDNGAALATLASQISWRIYADLNGQPAGRPGVSTDPQPLLTVNTAANAAALSYSGAGVRIDLIAAGVPTANRTLTAGRYWLSMTPTLPSTAVNWNWFNSSEAQNPAPRYVTPNARGNANRRLWDEINPRFDSTAFAGLALAVDVEVACGAPWLSAEPASGSLGVAGSAAIELSFDASALDPGSYQAQLCVDSLGSSPTPASALLPVSFEVAPPPSEPALAVNDSYSTQRNQSLQIAAPGVLENDIGPIDAVLTAQPVEAPSLGELQLAADGGFLYTPDTDACGDDSFSYLARYQAIDSSPAAVTIAVACSNRPPQLDSPIADRSDAENATVAFDVAPHFSDADGDALQFGAENLPAGLSISAGGLISGSLSFEASGSYSVLLTASDPSGDSAEATFTWRVSDVNRDPALLQPLSDRENVLGASIEVALAGAFNDPDADLLNYSATGLPNGLSISSLGLISGTISFDAGVGVHAVTVSVSDGRGGTASDSFDWTLRAENRLPVVTSPLPARNDAEADSVAFSVSSHFSDPDGDALQFTASNLPEGVAMDAAGQVTGTLSFEAAGSYSVGVQADDGNGGNVASSFNWQVADLNRAPQQLSDLPDRNHAIGAEIAIALIDYFEDPDGDPLSFTAEGLPPGLSLSADGMISGSVQAPEAVYTVNLTVEDGRLGSVDAQFVWSVRSNNSVPQVVSTPPDRSNAEGQSIAFTLAGHFDDADDDPLQISASNLPAGVTMDSAGLVTGNLSFQSSGSYQVQLQADDGNGGSVQTGFTWQVEEVNRPPQQLSPLANREDLVGAVIAIALSAAFDDPDADPLSFAADGLPPGLGISSSGEISGTLQAPAGVHSVQLTVSDGRGGILAASFEWTVRALNAAPQLIEPLPDQLSREGDTVALAIFSYFSDADGDPLQFSASNLPDGVSIDSAGQVSGSLSFQSAGSRQVVVLVEDGLGGSVQASFSWQVDDRNRAPLQTSALDDLNHALGTSIARSLAGHFSDPDADPLHFSAQGLPTGLTINSGGFISGVLEAPAAVHNVQVSVDDGKQGSSQASFVWTVRASNSAPQLLAPIPDQSDAEGDSINLSLAGQFTDSDNDVLSFSAVGLPPGLVLSAAGTISGQLGPTAAGVHSVVINVSDGNGGHVSDGFNWTVSDVNRAPLLTSVPPDRSNVQGASVSVDLSALFSDPDGDVLSHQASGLPTGLGISASGWVSGSVEAAPGNYLVTLRATDPAGLQAATQFDWEVRSNNSPPQLLQALPDQESSEGQTVQIALAGAFFDADGDQLNFRASGLPEGISLSNDGMLSGILGYESAGLFGVTVSVDDGNGAEAQDSFLWTVAAVNRAPQLQSALRDQSHVRGVSIDLLLAGHFLDPDGDPLGFSAEGLPAGLQISGSGRVFGTLSATVGSYIVSITVNDGGASFSSAFVWEVRTNNSPPVLLAPLADQSDPEGAIVSLPLAAQISDADGDRLTFTASGLPAGVVLDGTGTLSGQLSFSSAGQYQVQIGVDDGNGGSLQASFGWQVSDSNRAPQLLQPIADRIHAVGAVIAFDLAPHFADPDQDALSFNASGLPNGLSVSPQGLISGTVADPLGSRTVQIVVADGRGGQASTQFGWSVRSSNAAPQLQTPLPDRNHTEGDAVSFDLAPHFIDPDADQLSYAASGLPSGLQLIGTRIEGQLGFDAAGQHRVILTVSDPSGGSVQADFGWQISNRNRAPAVVGSIPSQRHSEGTSLQLGTAAYFSEPDGEPLSYAASGLPANLVIDANSGLISGTLSFTAAGTYIVRVDADDGQLTSAQSFVWSVDDSGDTIFRSGFEP